MLLCTLLLASACSSGSAKAGLAPNENLAPSIVSLELQVAQRPHGTDESAIVRAKGRLSNGGLVNEPSDWEALDGGTVQPVGDGSIALFSSKDKGTYRVIGRGRLKNGGGGGGGGGGSTPEPEPIVDTVTVTVEELTSPIASIDISPATATVVLNTTQVFTVAATRADGTQATPIVTWSASGGGTIVSAGAGAEYRAGSTKGTWSVGAVATEGASDVAAVQVTDAWLVEDFSEYTSTSDMMADPKGIYSAEEFNPSRISFDPAVRLNGLPGSMRYDFPSRTSLGGSGTSGRCTDYSIGRNLTLPEQVQEVWVEVWIRFSPGFTTVAPSEWGCTSNPDYKSVFLRVNGQTARFGYTMGNAVGKRWVYSPPPSEPDFVISGSATSPTIQTIWSDGQWHRYRYYGSVRDGGKINGWVDDHEFGLKTKADGLQVTATGIYSIALGRNLNQGPATSQSVWWGKVTVWRTNPGW